MDGRTSAVRKGEGVVRHKCMTEACGVGFRDAGALSIEAYAIVLFYLLPEEKLAEAENIVSTRLPRCRVERVPQSDRVLLTQLQDNSPTHVELLLEGIEPDISPDHIKPVDNDSSAAVVWLKDPRGGSHLSLV